MRRGVRFVSRASDPRSARAHSSPAGQLIRTDANFAYWPLVGWQESRKGNGWALLHRDAEGYRAAVHDDDWRAAGWTRLVTAQGRTGRVAPVAD
jgi:endoglucanase